jgi:flagellar protein FliO/FliZ
MDIGGVDIFKFILALVLVLGLIGVFAVMARRMGFGHRGPARRGANRRLEILDSIILDPKRRAILLRRDGSEHLILLGMSGETVVERNIDRGEPRPLREPPPLSPRPPGRRA